MIEETKKLTYSELVETRKKCRLCSSLGLTNPAEVEGHIDSNEIGPWTRWNGDLDARILVVGQEWGDVASFKRQSGLDTASPTNEMLVKLLASVGIHSSNAPKGDTNSGIFLTNAALCLKQGGAQAPVHMCWFINCAKTFLRNQILLVRPRVVVTLGERAYYAVCHGFELKPEKKFATAVGLHVPIQLTPSIHMVPVYHCGQRILNTHRPPLQQFGDWRLVKSLLAEHL